MVDLIKQYIIQNSLAHFLTNASRAPESDFQDTGYPAELESHLSSTLVHVKRDAFPGLLPDTYGTISQHVVLFRNNGAVVCVERTREDDLKWTERRFEFDMESPILE